MAGHPCYPAAVGRANLTVGRDARDSGQGAPAPSRYAVMLWVLAGLVFLRVLGQALVGFFALRLQVPRLHLMGSA